MYEPDLPVQRVFHVPNTRQPVRLFFYFIFHFKKPTTCTVPRDLGYDLGSFSPREGTNIGFDVLFSGFLENVKHHSTCCVLEVRDSFSLLAQVYHQGTRNGTWKYGSETERQMAMPCPPPFDPTITPSLLPLRLLSRPKKFFRDDLFRSHMVEFCTLIGSLISDGGGTGYFRLLLSLTSDSNSYSELPPCPVVDNILGVPLHRSPFPLSATPPPAGDVLPCFVVVTLPHGQPSHTLPASSSRYPSWFHYPIFSGLNDPFIAPWSLHLWQHFTNIMARSFHIHTTAGAYYSYADCNPKRTPPHICHSPTIHFPSATNVSSVRISLINKMISLFPRGSLLSCAFLLSVILGLITKSGRPNTANGTGKIMRLRRTVVMMINCEIPE